MRWPLVVIVALLAVLGLSACGDDDDDSAPGIPGGGTVYDDPQGRFELTLPANLVRDQTGQVEADLAFVATEPDTSGGQPFRQTITVSITEDITATLDKAAVAYRNLNLQNLPAYDPNIDERVELTDGTPAQLLGGIFEQDGLRLQMVQLLVAAQDTGYLVQATNPVASYPDVADLLRASLLSFTIRNPTG